MSKTSLKQSFSRRLQPPDPLQAPEVPYWWTWDAPGERYMHRATGEQVRYMGPVHVADASGAWPWHRFDYVHEVDGAWYPLLVEIRIGAPEPYNGISQWIDWTKAGPLEYEDRHPFGKEHFQLWRVDHDRSMALWRQTTGQPDALPPYGLWRRADLAMIASALTLPPPEGHLPPPEMVMLNGGWLNGEWRSALYRRSTYSWHRASGADKNPVGPDGKMQKGHGARIFYPLSQASLLPLHADCPVWTRGEMQVLWQDPRVPDTAPTVACMRNERTGELLYVTCWKSEDPITGKKAYGVDLHYVGYGLIVRDTTDFRYRPAEQVLTDLINVSQDFSPCDFVQSVTTPARARLFQFYDVDLARTLIPDLKVSENLLAGDVACDPEDIVDWRELRGKAIGSWRLGLVLQEALAHALPFSAGFDLGASVRRQTLGERASFDFRSGETGCSWLYETSMRLEKRLASDGDGPGWELLFD
jgi:hypothetical protein